MNLLRFRIEANFRISNSVNLPSAFFSSLFCTLIHQRIGFKAFQYKENTLLKVHQENYWYILFLGYRDKKISSIYIDFHFVRSFVGIACCCAVINPTIKYILHIKFFQMLYKKILNFFEGFYKIF